ncbi:hypothetical protein K2173_014523 [Erythroxylum novogranatense]|uniref:Uncharacterized protein n=1 Tax=Erythroxylum novogranatense TaxID=1862640 RepID=A0AAV8S5F7_9ROSI|nr:hypothetical protein K2173_014523 [Erythroxylum novogranatense]
MGEPASPLGPFPPLSSTVAAGSPTGSRGLEEGELRESPSAGRGAWRDLLGKRQHVGKLRYYPNVLQNGIVSLPRLGDNGELLSARIELSYPWKPKVENRQWVATGRMFSSCWHDGLVPEVKSSKERDMPSVCQSLIPATVGIPSLEQVDQRPENLPQSLPKIAGVAGTDAVVREVPGETSSPSPSNPLDEAAAMPIEGSEPQLDVGSQPEVVALPVLGSSVGLEAGLAVEQRVHSPSSGDSVKTTTVKKNLRKKSAKG